MDKLLTKLKVQVTDSLYLKDPESSELGINIIKHGMLLIDELGYENFTFRKLGTQIGSNEASIYRYFESKGKFLMYLSSWYWAWMEYNLVMSINNIKSAETRLDKALHLLTENTSKGEEVGHFNMYVLNRIITYESSKAFLTKEVDKVNQEGAFVAYKQFVARVSQLVKEIEPKYKFPNMLVTTVIEGIHLQKYFGDHLPGLTNKQSNQDYLYKFFHDLVYRTIK